MLSEVRMVTQRRVVMAKRRVVGERRKGRAPLHRVTVWVQFFDPPMIERGCGMQFWWVMGSRWVVRQVGCLVGSCTALKISLTVVVETEGETEDTVARYAILGELRSKDSTSRWVDRWVGQSVGSFVPAQQG